MLQRQRTMRITAQRNRRAKMAQRAARFGAILPHGRGLATEAIKTNRFCAMCGTRSTKW